MAVGPSDLGEARGELSTPPDSAIGGGFAGTYRERRKIYVKLVRIGELGGEIGSVIDIVIGGDDGEGAFRRIKRADTGSDVPLHPENGNDYDGQDYDKGETAG